MGDSRVRAAAFGILAPLYLLVIIGVPGALIAALVAIVPWQAVRVATIGLAPAVFGVVYVALAALLSLPHQHAVVPGTFPRKVGVSAYFHRRLYGLCWTSVYYCTPVYFGVLSVPWLKRTVFRAFGYRGHPDFTTYPDTWIRDLPLLDLRAGAYLSNKATLGTNVVMSDGTIVVKRISVGQNTIVGHLAAIGPGCQLGDACEVGVAAAIGFSTKLEDGVSIGPCCAIEHGVIIGSGTYVGACTHVLSRSRFGPKLRVPGGLNVPGHTMFRTQSDVDGFVSFSREHAGNQSPAPDAPAAVPRARREPADPTVLRIDNSWHQPE